MGKCESEIAALKEIISSGGGASKGQPVAGASVNDIILLRNRVRLLSLSVDGICREYTHSGQEDSD